MGWPEEHGGRGLSLGQQVVFHEEYARAVAPARVNHLGEELLGPVLPERWVMPTAIAVHVLTLLFGIAMAWNCALLLASVRSYAIPTLGISEAWRYVPLVTAGGLVALFSAEHIVALLKGIEVEKAWH